MRVLRSCVLAITACLAALPAAAQDFIPFSDDEGEDYFVADNILAAFYHELGHALIDQLQLPVLGREEDAADTLATLLTHELWEEEAAERIIYNTAIYYGASAAMRGDASGMLSDEHALDEQRYFSMICLYYGAAPAEREALAISLELPEERAVRCPDEYAQAADSWWGLIDELTPADAQGVLYLVNPDSQDPITDLLATEFEFINQNYAFAYDVPVEVGQCGEPNAFYVPGDGVIIMCTEYADYMLALIRSIQ